MFGPERSFERPKGTVSDIDEALFERSAISKRIQTPPLLLSPSYKGIPSKSVKTSIHSSCTHGSKVKAIHRVISRSVANSVLPTLRSSQSIAMALDCRANWQVQMQVRTIPARSADRSDLSHTVISPEKDSGHTSSLKPPTTPIHLPDEIIIRILDYLAALHDAQASLASVCLLSRQYYSAAISFLYHQPILYGKNFDPFTRAICPSINLHVRRSPLSKLVRILDLGKLVHQGSKSVTARLLGRTKEHLQYFRAPQASFAVNCLPALAKCQSLRTLDLSLVSESPPLADLLRTVARIDSLLHLCLPRSSGFGVHSRPTAFAWPARLEHLALSGGIDDHFSRGVVAFPITLRSLTLEHCPHAKGFAVAHLLRTAVQALPRLEEVRIAYMPRLSSHALDSILLLLPQISKLSVSVDYITPAMFDESHFNHKTVAPLAVFEAQGFEPDRTATIEDKGVFSHSHLRMLELTNSGNPSVEDKISPIDIMLAIDDNVLPALRVVRVAKSLDWQGATLADETEALADALVEASKADWDAKQSQYMATTRKDSLVRPWEKWAGVWTFDG
ncbi:hypothetical protein LTR95_008404 [Oleoguttula sp. CCFEE 5521]